MQEELHRHKFLGMNTPLKQFINTVLVITLFNLCFFIKKEAQKEVPGL